MAVTIGEVAHQAGVSRSTVSRAFSLPELVNADTRTRILDVARRLGYTPNRNARALARGRTGAIGLIVPDIANPFFPPIIKGVQARARHHDHTVFVADTDERPTDEHDIARSMSKQVDGLILASSRMTEHQLRELAELRPTVLVNRQVDGIPAVLLDNADGTSQAVEHLHALGHRHICYLAGPRNSWSNRARADAVRVACERHGMELIELGHFDPQFEAGVRAGDLVAANDATGCIAYDDVIALGVISRLSERGFRAGVDVSVIGFDDSPASRMSVPPLTTVRVPGTEAGITAVDLMLDVLEVTATDRSEQPPIVQLETQLIVRASTGPVAARVDHATTV